MRHRNVIQRLRTWGAWLALLAVGVNTLLPLASLARPASDDTIVLCTAHGIQIVAIDRESGLPGEPQQFGGAHCPFCASAGAMLITAAPTRPDVPIPLALAVRPFYFEHSLGTGRTHTAAAPRGPPGHA